jgi:cell division protein FtsB
VNGNVLLEVLVSLVAVILTCAVSVGGWAALRVAKNTQTVTNYKEAASAWETKSKAQDAEIHELKEENAKLQQRVSDLNGKVSVLQDLVTGAPLLADFDAKVTAKQDEMLVKLNAIEGLVKSVAQQ